MKSKESPLVSIILTIVVPVVILNYLTETLGAAVTLVLGLSFPLGYGVYKAIQEKRLSWLALLGFTNVLLTGGFSLLNLDGGWFVVKEAALPLVLACIVMASSWTSRPFAEFLLENPLIFNVDKIHQALQERQSEGSYKKLKRQATRLLSLSFVISALLNLILAMWIFRDGNTALTESELMTERNKQIADMNLWSFVVIALPLSLLLFWLVWHSIRELKKLTQLSMDELLVDGHQAS